MGQSIQLKRSSVVTNGEPKLPQASQLDFGEIAINFAAGHETLSIKNNDGNIATFSSDSVFEKEFIASASVVTAIQGIDTRVSGCESSAQTLYTTLTGHTSDTGLHLPAVTSANNGKILQVVNGVWTLVTPVTIYTGDGTPASSLGNDGDIYLQTS